MGKITFQKAIQIAIGSTRDNNVIDEKERSETIKILENVLKRDYFTYWDKDKIIEALMDYKERTGLTPTVTSLTEIGMPKATTIRTHFHIKASLLLKQLFPENRRTRPEKMYTNPYGFDTEEAWLKCFTEQFHKCGCPTSRRYNALRDKDTPTWNTIARYLKLKGWKELMTKAQVSYPNKVGTASEVQLTSTTSPTLEKLEEIVRQKQRLNDELLDVLK